MNDEELEKAMLYYLIYEQEDYVLDETDFAFERNKRIIKAINELKAEKKEISIISLQSRISANNKQVIEYLTSLSEYVYATTADYIYNQVIELSKKRKLMALLQKSITELMEAENIDIFMQDKIKQINKIAEINEKEQTFVEQVVETSTEIEKNTLQKPDYTLYTGITDLDKMICGLHKQELTIIGARPGVGKTTLALQIAEHIAERGTETAIISLEMSDTQVIQKLISRRARINSYKMRMGTLETKELEQVGIVSAEIAELPIHLITKARTIQHIENIARKLKNKNNLGLIVIDYIQLIKNKGKFNSREQEVADITRTLKLLSLELNIPIVGLCQLNRNAARQEPTLADLRESGAIEQDADNILFLYQEAESTETVVDITLKLAKQRAGETGKIDLKFNKANSEFKGVMRW
ncbi:replicative DNA helicase [Clostridium sp. CAG:492]|nr:replicative DNA helicase [Clostridium sp. CAG:492]